MTAGPAPQGSSDCVAEPFLRSALKRLGRRRLDGLAATLARRRSGSGVAWGAKPSGSATGAEMRVTSPAARRGRVRERRPGAEVRGNLERVARVARRPARAALPAARVRRGALPDQVVAAPRLCVDDARAAVARSAPSGRCCSASRWAAQSRSRPRTSRRSSACSGSRRGSPTGSRSSRSAASGSTSSTARSTAGCPASPASRPPRRAAASSAPAPSASEGTYELHPRRAARARAARAGGGLRFLCRRVGATRRRSARGAHRCASLKIASTRFRYCQGWSSRPFVCCTSAAPRAARSCPECSAVEARARRRPSAITRKRSAFARPPHESERGFGSFSAAS